MAIDVDHLALEEGGIEPVGPGMEGPGSLPVLPRHGLLVLSYRFVDLFGHFETLEHCLPFNPTSQTVYDLRF